MTAQIRLLNPVPPQRMARGPVGNDREGDQYADLQSSTRGVQRLGEGFYADVEFPQ